MEANLPITEDSGGNIPSAAEIAHFQDGKAEMTVTRRTMVPVANKDCPLY